MEGVTLNRSILTQNMTLSVNSTILLYIICQKEIIFFCLLLLQDIKFPPAKTQYYEFIDLIYSRQLANQHRNNLLYMFR
jgi:hypothetical protein